MSNLKPELSPNNPYYISKHRYYELKHFCLQYPVWKKAYESLDGLSKRPADLEQFTIYHYISDPTSKCALAKEVFSRKIGLIEQAAEDADEEIANYIIAGVTEDRSYDYLLTYMNIPCSRDTYYDRYRRFFWLLNKYRD